MPKLHEKISLEHLHAGKDLLSPNEMQIIKKIQCDIKVFQGRAQAIIKLSDTISQEISALEDEYNICNDLEEVLINNVFFSIEEDITAYKKGMIDKLSSICAKIKSPITISFLKSIITEINNNESSRWDLAEELTDVILPNKIEEFEGIEKLQQLDRSQIIFDEIQSKREILIDNHEKLQELSHEITQYKQRHNYDFDLDENFQLVKISKRTQDLNFSILFVNDRDNPSQQLAFALYRGKDSILGSGKNGLFKICQNIHTSDWAAVKILPYTAFKDSEFETEVLNEVGRLDGINAREGKHYIVQTLLFGDELKNYIDNGKLTDITTALQISKQAVALVCEFNQTFLHRDIKPDNFIWDSKNQTLYLCDFGYSCRLNYPATEALGSNGYIAPEILAVNEGNLIPYSIQSERYALGKTFEYLFTGFEDIPEEITNIITELTLPDPNERYSGKYSDIIARIESIDPDHSSVADLR